MDGRKSFGILASTGAALLLGAIAACAQPAPEASHGTSSAVTAPAFDRNSIIDDKSMRDSDALGADDLQKILDNNPWNNKSVLATYTEGGKTAAQIMADTAKAHNINPLEMIVRVQMEQGLVNKTTATDAVIAKAFGCGCADGATCSVTYAGFANQAECAAGILDRAMTAATTSSGTVSGWAKGKSKDTLDLVTIVPKTAATAALYTYTPWVGETGGGRAGVGGVSLHAQVWTRFATAAGYATTATAPVTQPAGSGDADASADPPPPVVDPNQDPSDPSDPSDPDPSDPSTDADAGADAGAKGDGKPSTKTAPPPDGTGDSKIINENGDNEPAPASNAPPPTGKINTKPEELPNASDSDLAGKPKDSGGCSTTGSSSTSNAWLVGLAVALVALRRRRAA